MSTETSAPTLTEAAERLRAERADTMEVVHEMEILLLNNPRSVQAQLLFFNLPQALVCKRERFVSVFSRAVRPLAAALYELLRGNE